MFQRDYFMRMIEEMTQVLAQVLGLRQERKIEEALLVIDELLDKHFRLSSNLIRSLSDDDLIKVMSTNGVVETDHLQAIAVLIKQEALLHGDIGREKECYDSYVRSLRLFVRLSLLNAEPTIVEPREQIAELLELLSPFELPIPTKRLLMEWYETEGKYDQTENVMHELLEANVLTAADAIGTYQRLLSQSDELLTAGGLPREEVEQALADIKGAMKE
ncbi:hypothetical protein I6N90_19630 [Paenibacillus sp. GSMTC-2017]|uniref:DUF6483 family protein n=1 Tax=Paenibacillus sp. GSMTC-2017 TaxID=2794350 RepID=UPI0018D62684|nr:DUF6483 family protein [Paenibacillus sp. GSMTC-2017]MBH5320016.1 hypothetical protein [Paenibacillus sp. GSMTC-2017]